MKLAKNRLGDQILYRTPDPAKKRHHKKTFGSLVHI